MATELTPPPEPGYYWCNCGLIKRGGHMDIRWRHPRCTCSGDRMTIAERDGARADRDEAIQRADDAEAEIRELMEAILQHKRRAGAAEKETSKATARAERVVAGDLSEAAADPPVEDLTEAERDDVWTTIDLPARATITEYTTVAQGTTMTIDAELEIIKMERDAVNKTAEDIEARVKSLLEEANRYQKQADDAEKEAAEATLNAEEAVETAKAKAEAEEAARVIAEAEQAARAKAEAEAEEATKIAKAVAEAARVAAEPTNVPEGLSWDIIGNTVVTGFASAVGSIFGSVQSVGGAAVGGVGKAVISGVGSIEKKLEDGSQRFTASLVVTGTLLIICLVLKEK
ncbi:hypothetical protein Q9L58_009257 [Maublancomyces gigas]|uniref:Uncharacterized protein n=1 Tax=Discina gigas TaxID=1032678 RepID=A0ABR3G850_9PEZI